VRKIALLVTLAVLGAACARPSNGAGGSTGATGSIEHPTGASDLVLRVETTGGLIAPTAALATVPPFSLFGDGTVVTQGAQIEIYPGPALPPLIETHVTEEGIQAILRAASESGLLGSNASYLGCAVPDVGTTTFTVDAEGSTHSVKVAALGADTCPKDAGARKQLADFAGELGDLRSWLPSGSVGPDEPYRFSEVRVIVQPYTRDPSLPEPAIDWPLSSDLATFGTPVGSIADARCSVVGGDDLSTLMPDLRHANQLTPWRSGSEEYSLLFRPLLPDEHGCYEALGRS
jgi:hypothetical protein